MRRPGVSDVTATLTLRQLNRTTLMRQSLLARSPWSATEAVRRLAGLQAQQPNPPYVALWSRVDGFEIADLVAALRERTVVKGTLMRSTLHLVAADDVAAYDAAASQARIRNWRATAERAGVDVAELHRQLLAYTAEPRTVAEMEAFVDTVASATKLAQAAPAGVRGVPFRVASSPGRLVHVPPSGEWDSFGKARYIDLGTWLPDAPAPDPETALRIAAERYLTAYGPASAADIGKWVGQPRLPLVRAALDGLGERVRRFVGPDGRDLVDLDGLPIANGDEDAPVRFLARWDSVIIGYDVRERILPGALFDQVVRIKNGDFLPTFTVDGFVAGWWMIATTKGHAALGMHPSVTIPAGERVALTDEAERLVRFAAPGATSHEIIWEPPP